MTQIVANILITPDGTRLQSYHRHDFKTYLDKNGKEYMIDGGNEYVRRSAHGDEVVYTVTTDDSFDDIRANFHWGTRGKDGKQPLTWKPLKSLDTDHIQAILETQFHIPQWARTVFEEELKYRELTT